jgi:hypothetical protein
MSLGNYSKILSFNINARIPTCLPNPFIFCLGIELDYIFQLPAANVDIILSISEWNVCRSIMSQFLAQILFNLLGASMKF